MTFNLMWCPICEKISERENLNLLAHSVKRHVVGIDGRPVYHGYCCPNPNPRNEPIFRINPRGNEIPAWAVKGTNGKPKGFV